jgi:hypothetical protein
VRSPVQRVEPLIPYGVVFLVMKEESIAWTGMQALSCTTSMPLNSSRMGGRREQPQCSLMLQASQERSRITGDDPRRATLHIHSSPSLCERGTAQARQTGGRESPALDLGQGRLPSIDTAHPCPSVASKKHRSTQQEGKEANAMQRQDTLKKQQERKARKVLLLASCTSTICTKCSRIKSNRSKANCAGINRAKIV